MSLVLTFTPLCAYPLPRAPLAALEDEEVKISEYRRLLGTLPTVNRATLKALINHLFRYSVGTGSAVRPSTGSPSPRGVLGRLWGGGEPSSLGSPPGQGKEGDLGSSCVQS